MFSSASIAIRKHVSYTDGLAVSPHLYNDLGNDWEVNLVEDEEVQKLFGDFSDEEELAEGKEDASGPCGAELEAQDPGDVRIAKRMLNPKLPSKEEVEIHEMTHLPFRNWCAFCVKGCSYEGGHFRAERDERAIPEVHVDFCFLGSEVGKEKLTTVVAKERDSGMIMSSVIPTKASEGKFAASRVAAFCRELGFGSAKIIMKSDQ